MHRAVAFVVAVAAVLYAPAAAHADPGPGSGGNQGWTDGQGVGATASSPGTPSGPSTTSTGSSGGGSAPVCTYTPLSPQESQFADENAAQGWGPAKGTGPGGWYREVCTVDAQGNTSGIVVWLAAPPGAPPVDPAALAQQALGFAPLNTPAIHLNPPANRDQLVGAMTWLWISGGWSPVSASASAGGVTVITTAAPEHVTWNMGDGHTVTCDGPGTPYESSRPDAQPSCSYTYSSSSAGQENGAYTITVTESWAVAWTANGAPPGTPVAGTLPAVTRTAQLPVRVAESQAINTGGST